MEEIPKGYSVVEQWLELMKEAPPIAKGVSVAPDVLEYLRENYRAEKSPIPPIFGIPVFIDPSLEPGEWYFGEPRHYSSSG